MSVELPSDADFTRAADRLDASSDRIAERTAARRALRDQLIRFAGRALQLGLTAAELVAIGALKAELERED